MVESTAPIGQYSTDKRDDVSLQAPSNLSVLCAHRKLHNIEHIGGGKRGNGRVALMVVDHDDGALVV